MGRRRSLLGAWATALLVIAPHVGRQGRGGWISSHGDPPFSKTAYIAHLSSIIKKIISTRSKLLSQRVDSGIELNYTPLRI